MRHRTVSNADGRRIRSELNWGSDVRDRLSWYAQILESKAPPKYKLCKTIPCHTPLKTASLDELWTEHERLAAEFLRIWTCVRSGLHHDLEVLKPNFLDLKFEIANRILDSCTYCEWNCKVNRNAGKIGVCRLDKKSRVASWFLHFGEETPLVNNFGSGTIFFTGCMFRCVFCQNWDISQFPLAGVETDGAALADIMKRLWQQKAQNINFVGGEPTPNLHTIFAGMANLDADISMLWNSDMYGTIEFMNLLKDVIDIWLPDFKYGNDQCALRLSNVYRYFEVITRNHKIARDSGDMLVRHLVLPGHFSCCTKPVLDWISENCPHALVNIMKQYRPDFRVLKKPQRYSEISRRLYPDEIETAYDYAHRLGIAYEAVS